MSLQNVSRHPLSVLVVDDEPDTAESLAELLAFHGHAVRVALTGADALRLADEDAPDVVLLDLWMPGVDGYTVARELRRRAGGKRPFLVAVTGCGTADDRARSAAAGFDLHLVKPVDPPLIVGVLERFRRLLAPPTPAPDLGLLAHEDPPDPRGSHPYRTDGALARPFVVQRLAERV